MNQGVHGCYPEGDAEGYVATITLTELAYIYTRKTDERP